MEGIYIKYLYDEAGCKVEFKTENDDKVNKMRNLLTSMKKAGIIDTDSDNQQKSNWILK